MQTELAREGSRLSRCLWEERTTSLEVGRAGWDFKGPLVPGAPPGDWRSMSLTEPVSVRWGWSLPPRTHSPPPPQFAFTTLDRQDVETLEETGKYKGEGANTPSPALRHPLLLFQLYLPLRSQRVLSLGQSDAVAHSTDSAVRPLVYILDLPLTICVNLGKGPSFIDRNGFLHRFGVRSK